MISLILATGLAAVILACGLAVAALAVRGLLRHLGPFLDSLGPLREQPPDPAAARIGASVAALDGSDALAIVCGPCNGEPGRCTCAGLCGHKDCTGDHTVTWDMAVQLDELLYGTGEVDELGRPE